MDGAAMNLVADYSRLAHVLLGSDSADTLGMVGAMRFLYGQLADFAERHADAGFFATLRDSGELNDFIAETSRLGILLDDLASRTLFRRTVLLRVIDNIVLAAPRRRAQDGFSDLVLFARAYAEGRPTSAVSSRELLAALA